MAEEDNPKIRKFLGDPSEFQLGLYPYKSLFWNGSLVDSDPRTLSEAVLLRTIQPIVSGYHMNLTKNRISSAGWDAWDEFWTQEAGVDFTGLGPFISELGKFFKTRNSMDANTIVTDTSVNVASQAAFVLTVPAGHAYKVIFASLRNSTAAATGSLAFTPNGGTASLLTPLALGIAIGETQPLLGAFGLGGGSSLGMTGPLWMQVGDTLEISEDGFTAADVMRHDFIFEDYAL